MHQTAVTPENSAHLKLVEQLKDMTNDPREDREKV